MGLLIHKGVYELWQPAPSSGLRFRNRSDPGYDPEVGYPDHLYVYTGTVNSFAWAASKDQQWEPNTDLTDGVAPGGERILPEGYETYASILAPAWEADGRTVYGGAFFWVNQDGQFPVPASALYMAGAGGQNTIVIPSHDMVVVRLGCRQHRNTPARTRTWDPRLRRPMLYPAELRARKRGSCGGAHTLDQEANRGFKEAPVCRGGDGGWASRWQGPRTGSSPIGHRGGARRWPKVAETPGMLVHFAPVTGRRGPWMQPLPRRVDPFHGLTDPPFTRSPLLSRRR